MAANRKKILLLVHPTFNPMKIGVTGTERDVWLSLRRMGYAVEVSSVKSDLRLFDMELGRTKPQVVFNLLEEFRGEAVFDFHLVSFLEAMGIPYTGCNPRGLVHSRSKDLCGRLASTLGIRVPQGGLVQGSGAKTAIGFPQFVKLNREHASLGICESNLVHSVGELKREVTRLRKNYGGEILAQEFIEGHDVSVAVWGNSRAEVFEPRRLDLRGRGKVATERLKFNRESQKRRGARSNLYRGAALAEIRKNAARVFEALDMSGYARLDFRVTEEHEAFLIDVNANPNLARDEDFALSARARELSYEDVLTRVINLALRYRPRV